jgi:hypothetical protein
MSELTFFIIDHNATHADVLRAHLAGLPNVSVITPIGRVSREIQDLDVLEVSSFYAAEKWGAMPQIHCAQIIPTSTEQDRAEGWPKYVITGVALAPGDPTDAEFAAESIIGAIIKAVRQHNSTEKDQINRVGLEIGWLGLRRISPVEAAKVLRSALDA